jgi:hypothetical protein
MSIGGIQHAIGYCNTNALDITDSLSALYGAGLRRTSDRYRNELNKPDSAEAAIIDDYRTRLAEGMDLKPILLEDQGKPVRFYAPILVRAPLCLSCHGEPGNTMIAEDADYLKAGYPDDRATGYKLGELRGLWVVTFNKETGQ